ncbi:hypothetical protein ACFL0U_02110 [Pseudomonadota bacterium]
MELQQLRKVKLQLLYQQIRQSTRWDCEETEDGIVLYIKNKYIFLHFFGVEFMKIFDDYISLGMKKKISEIGYKDSDLEHIMSEEEFHELRNIILEGNIHHIELDLTPKDIRYNELGECNANHLKKLAGTIGENEHLAVLNLNSNRLSHSDGRVLFTILERNKNLRILCLANNGLAPHDAKFLAISLRENAYLKVLDLRCNKLGDQGVMFVIAALKENTSLETLHLAGNGITAKGAENIGKLLAYIEYREGRAPTFEVLLPKNQMDIIRNTRSVELERLKGLKEDEKTSSKKGAKPSPVLSRAK